ncbi:hypothetical protein D9758_014153 [Tetrapyrgos nigripes]|uniref:Uncharacterized protein n=1 Tax=Tetrapyrgos nigripes TaxID=182062 RepID=A0A8H5CN32_9AGAR|nr:hypothetical protein D9758_014153 [Tetrapyrgos nigripes]
MSSVLSDPASVLAPTLGALEFGVLLSTLLYGAAFVQTVNYFQGPFTSDHASIKLMVIFVWIIETIHTGLLWASLYNKTIENFADLEALAQVHWTIGLSVPITNLIVCSVQGFFAHRVSVLSKNPYYFTFAIPVLLLRLGLGITCAITTHSATFAVYIVKFRWLVVTTLAVGAVIDIINTTALLLCLRQGGAGQNESEVRFNSGETESSRTRADHRVLEPHTLEIQVDITNSAALSEAVELQSIDLKQNKL